jgi:hypothetical protein
MAKLGKETVAKEKADDDPDSIGEYMVAEMAVSAKCADELVSPPPKDCPGYIHAAHAVASWHILTVLFAVMMVAFIIQLTLQSKE